MKSRVLPLMTALILVAAVSAGAAEAPQAIAAKAVGQLGQEMRKKLIDSLQKNGPAGAIDVCAKDAPVITSRIEQELGVTIKRTSLKVRNPLNAPDAAEKELLESLAASRANGTPLPAGVTPFPHDQRRFYKTVTIEQPCLKCHGDQATIGDAVRREIAATYPDDKATGYKEGDFRGMISVTVK